MVNKTIENDASVEAFLNKVEDESKRQEAIQLLALMQEAADLPAKMWGTSIVGFGSYHYKYATGREGDWMSVGFSPRKANISVYLSDNVELYREFLDKLGKHKLGKGCVYITKLSDINTEVLQEMVKSAVTKRNPNEA
jgi:hypothetical protein